MKEKELEETGKRATKMASSSLSLLHPPFLLEEVTKGGGDYDTGLLQSQSDRRAEHMLQLHPLVAVLKLK